MRFFRISTSPGIKSFSTCREGAVRAACTGSRVQSKGHTGGLAWPMRIVDYKSKKGAINMK